MKHISNAVLLDVFIVFNLLTFTNLSFAQTIQVPENCINRVSPCLLRTEDSFFSFVQFDQKVTLFKEAIVKISFDNKQSNFEIIEGRIRVDRLKQGAKSEQRQLHINGQVFPSGKLLAERISNNLSILNLKNFILSKYHLESNSPWPHLISAEFVNKKDFVLFTKYYFQTVGQYKDFLTSVEENWKKEFFKQNSNQSKVLLRSVASEQKKSKTEFIRDLDDVLVQKKLKDNFFYRTFQR